MREEWDPMEVRGRWGVGWELGTLEEGSLVRLGNQPTEAEALPREEEM